MPKENGTKYRIESEKVNQLTKAGSIYFKNFTDNKNHESLDAAIQCFEQAIHAAEVSDNSLDLAHCYRRYASVIYRRGPITDPNHEADSGREEDMVAQEALVKAIDIFEQYTNDEIIQLELARALDLQRQIAYRQRNGELLVESANKLITLYNQTHRQSDNFLVNAYAAKFTCAFAKSDYQAAEAFHIQAGTYAIASQSHYAHHQHELKLGLLKVAQLFNENQDLEATRNYFKALVDKNFWPKYDEDKQLYKKRNNPKALISDLFLLFNIRLIQGMIGINHQYNAASDYVLKQARINFGSRSQKYLQFIEKLDKKIAEIRKMELIPFDYEYFKNERAGIKISGQELDRILSLNGKMNKGNLSTPGAFFTQNSRFHKDDSKLALRPPSSSAKR